MIPETEVTFEFEIEADSGDQEGNQDGLQDWLASHLDIAALYSIYEEDLKTDTTAGLRPPAAGISDVSDVGDKVELNGQVHDGSPPDDGPPDDIRAFYGHPLTAATTAVNEDDTHASAVALLHEYINLPALDKSGMKIGDKISSIYDIMREDGSGQKTEGGLDPTTDVEYINMLHTTLASEVDKFFIRDGAEETIASISDTRCPVGMAEEVIHEICDEPARLDQDPNTSTIIYTEISGETSAPNNTLPDGMVNADAKAITEGLPELVDASTTLCAIETSLNTTPTTTTTTKPSTGRRSRNHGCEKSQELSKKLVKALTEKILKRKNQQAMQESEENSAAAELKNAVATVTSMTSIQSETPTNDVTSFISDAADLTSKFSTFTEKHEQFLETLNDDLKIVEGQDCDTLTLQPTHPVGSQYSVVSTSSSHVLCSSPVNNVQSPGNTQSVSSLPPPPVNHPSLTSPTLTPMSSEMLGKHAQFARTNSMPGSLGQHVFVNNPAPTTNVTLNQNNNIPPTAVSNYYYPNGTNVYPPLNRPSINGNDGCDVMLERYIQQQNSYYQEQQNFQYSGQPGKDGSSYNMKSPDSGYGEACVSPKYQPNAQLKDSCEQYTSDADGCSGKVAKRRRSAPAMYVKQYWQSEKLSKCSIAKLEYDHSGYKYFLESPISTNQRIEEDRITYLNKGQYYGLTLEQHGERPSKNSMVKSVIMVVFREDKHLEDERKAWDFWHSRQHSYKQRVLDIDTKNSVGASPSSIDEISYNAVSVKWNPREGHVKVNVAVHCLSTDFSNQKGVKGFPLHIQIDTFENCKDTYPSSRAYCQIKVFCDKGAERKARDEERRKQCRVKSDVNPLPGKSTRKRNPDVYHPPTDRSEFYAMADQQTSPILFSPVFEADDLSRTSPSNQASHEEDGSSSSVTSGIDQYDSTEDTSFPPAKRQKVEPKQEYRAAEPYVPFTSYPHILLYVREKHEVVFTAIMLRSPTVLGLHQAIEEKYQVPPSRIRNSYKRSRKGILVRMDDNIIRHYSHESTFIIELNKVIGEDQDRELILTEIDPS